MRLHRSYILFVICLFVSFGAWAEEVYYASNQLRHIAAILGISDTISKMPDGFSHFELRSGLPLTVEKRQGCVTHIGYAVFSSPQRTSIGNTRCHFIERYLLTTDLPVDREKSVEQEMKEEKIVFSVGDLSTIKSLMGDTTLNVDAQIYTNKAHIVRWSRSDKTICEMAFPMDHELLRGIQMAENDERLEMDIKMTRQDDSYLSGANHFASLTKLDSMYVSEGGPFAKTSLMSRRYFLKSSDGTFLPVCIVDRPDESIANLLTDNDISNNYMLEISQQQYNFLSKTFVVPLNQWTEYLKQQGCVPYFGIIKKDTSVWECLLIAQHPHMGYCHLLRFQFDTSTLKDKSGKIPVRLNAFIPTSNIKDINVNP